MPEQLSHARPACGAKTRSGKPCTMPPVIGRTRCRMHGGATPRAGPDHHRITHGRFSKVLPGRIRERYEAALADTDLASLRDEIAVLVAREQEILAQLDTGEAGALWDALGDQWAALMAARASQNLAGQSAAINEIGSLIQRGAADWQAWRDFRSVAEDRRRMTETHEKLAREREYTWSSEQVAVLVEGFADIMVRYVDQLERRREAAREIEVFLHGRGRPVLAAGDRGG